MLEKLIESIVREQRIVLFIALLLFIGGIFAVGQLNIEAYPDPAPPLLEVLAQNGGWSAEEMERQVTVPLEAQLNGMTHLSHIRSSSLFGLTDIKCYFTYDSDYTADRQEVINRIQMANLPAGVQAVLSPQSTIGEILRYELVGPTYTQMELKEINDWLVVRQFRQVPGVVDVSTFGGPTKQYQVILDPKKMLDYKVSVGQVTTALANSNVNVGGAYLEQGSQSFNVRGIGLIDTNMEGNRTPDLSDIANSFIAEKNGVPVLVKNIGRVQMGRAIPLGRVGRDEKDDIVHGTVLMRVGEKTMPTLQGVRAKIKELNSTILPKGVHIDAYADRTDLINITTHTVQHTLISGMVLVIFILMAFLGDLRASLIVAMTIPLSLLMVFILLVGLGQSANLISMGAIDFGIIVDASVIMVENIHRHLSFRDPMLEREGTLSIVLEAAQEVARPILFSAMVLFVSFLPLFTMQGVEAKIFGPMALTYALALAAALILARTFAPSASALFLKKSDEKETWIVRVCRKPYGLCLRFFVKWAPLTVGLAFLTLLISLILVIPNLKGEYMPKLEEGNLWVRGTLPTSVSFKEASRIISRCRKIFLHQSEVITCVSQLGRPDDATDPTSWFNMEFYVPLTPHDQWPAGVTKADIIHNIEVELNSEFPGVSFGFSQNIEDNVEEAMSGVKGENSIKIVGTDLEKLETVAAQIEAALSKVDGVKDLGVFHVLGQPNLLIKPDRVGAARYGLGVGDVNNAVAAAVGSVVVSQVLEGDRQFALTVRFDAPYRDSPQSIGRIPLPTPEGAMVPLAQVANISYKSGAGFIFREDNQRYIPVKFSVRGRDLASTIGEVEKTIHDKVKFPPGYYYTIAGEFGQLQEAVKRFEVVVPVTLILVLMILARNFASMRDAFLVMVTVPLASLGGLMALYARGMVLSISAGVGFISLSGVCILEGVLLVSRIKQNLEDGSSSVAAVIHAAELRLRPVLMVALAAAIGLLPAATSNGIGSETQKPLATVVVGGMLTSVVVILWILPAIYHLVHRSREVEAVDPNAVPFATAAGH